MNGINRSVGALAYRSDGMMEYWAVRVLAVVPSMTPVFHNSSFSIRRTYVPASP